MQAKRERFTRVLPNIGKVLVEKGQQVFPDTLIAETKLQPVEPVLIPVAEKFGLAPTMMPQLVVVKEGENVKAGQVLAGVIQNGQVLEILSPADGNIEQISSLLGTIALRLEGDPDEPLRQVDIAKELDMPVLLAKRIIQVRVGDVLQMGDTLAMDEDNQRVLAPIAGVITQIDGAVISIKRPFVLTQTFAYVSGHVVEIVPDLGAVLESDLIRLNGIFGIGGEAWGELRQAVNTAQDILDAKEITAADQGKILLAGSLLTYEAMQKALQVGAAGIICGGAHNIDIVRLLGHEVRPGMMNQDIKLTLVITEGMGQIPMRQQFFQTVAAYEGKTVSINGLTQIRAGVIRPEILLPAGENDSISTETEQTVSVMEELQVGDTVRIIREPWFGLVGKITADPEQEVILPSGVQTLIYQLSINGELLAVPRANVEKFIDK
ncbi:MAG: hypothetical protein LLG09_03135 [Negativicutes bacterium]|nr:hypothetical protein [Negativicutes bacterium]